MHGKVSFYNPKTKIGTIIDKNKRVYEFSKNSWHDRYNLPLVGLFVDFRSDTQGKVSATKKSIYYNLSKKYGINESYFWNTKDDTFLADIVEKEIEELIASHSRKINVEIPIPCSRSIDESFDIEYFEQIELIYKFEYALDKKYENFRLDYGIFKSFIKSAKENLINLDGSILEDDFLDYEVILTKSEYLLSVLAMDIKKDKDRLFEEVFLNNQLEYRAFLKWQELAKERIFQINKILKNANSDQIRYQKLLQKELDNKSKLDFEEKLKKVLFHINQLQEEQKLLALKFEKNKKRVNEFINNKFIEFFEEYKFHNEQKKVFDYLKNVMNHVAFLCNYELYMKASKSVNIHSLSSQDFVNIPYSALSLASGYLKNINIDIASSRDKKLHEYIKRFFTNRFIQVLICSSESQMINRIKNICFREDMIFYCDTAQKNSEVVSVLKSKKIELLIIDKNIALQDEELKQLIEKNNNQMYILYLGETELFFEHMISISLPIKESILKENIKKIALSLGKYIRDKF